MTGSRALGGNFCIYSMPNTRRQAGSEPASPQPAADGDESPRVVLDQADLAALVSRAAEAAAEKAAAAATSEPTGVTRSCNSRFRSIPLRKSRIRAPWDVFCMLYRYPQGTLRYTKVFHTNCRFLQLDFILKFIQYSYYLA